MVWLPVIGIFNVRSDVDAYDCTHGGGLYGHRKRVCTGSGLREKKSLAAPGTRTASASHLAFQLDALSAELSPPLR